MVNWRKNAFLKRGVRYTLRYTKGILYPRVGEILNTKYPPVLLNSIPKSGTFLLFNILKEIGSFRDLGEFIASQPSTSLTPITSNKVIRTLNTCVERELVGSHLYYDNRLYEFLNKNQFKHILIIRDPRDVAISEMKYVKYMNRWHYAHKLFKDLSDDESLELSLFGGKIKGVDYPGLKTRLQPYLGWMNKNDVCIVRYEDLVGECKYSTLNTIFAYINEGTHYMLTEKEITEALKGFEPGKSHTYREGGFNKWKGLLSETQKDRIIDEFKSELELMKYI